MKLPVPKRLRDRLEICDELWGEPPPAVTLDSHPEFGKRRRKLKPGEKCAVLPFGQGKAARARSQGRMTSKGTADLPCHLLVV